MISQQPANGKAPETPVSSLPHFDVLPPLSLYIHIPWCIRKCPYCDFYSHEKTSVLPENEYLKVLRRDLELSLPLIENRKISSIFIGGGTPSLFSAGGIDKLLSFVRELLPVLPDAEISLEANPGTFEAGKFQSYRRSGINRLSIGVQSFTQERLHELGRIHDADEARAAVETAGHYFDNFNLDLMYGLPFQTLDQLKDDVSIALSYKPAHLSFYQLTIEPNTYYFKHPPVLPDEDAIDEMQTWIETSTAATGYEHYEVSAYARSGRQCLHNRNYWLFGDYLGIGAAAHSKITLPDQRIIRQMRLRNPHLYMQGIKQGIPLEEQFEVPVSDLGFEFMLNALRLTDGFSPALFRERTGLPLSVIDEGLARAAHLGLLHISPLHIRPTELGKRFLNDLQQIFLPD
ncbi:radical SAM family heme chaperone HemW [Oxalobacter paraformigenes]|uniref:Heme chaperone HemW n=1 Tax=Oxalobacter paraformigenes TaxID=556268 RepID=C3X280_9BURK|nr:radical SAM family heme chaperone HemW [Oxalobacter paraformigenes]EEO27316.1 putative oxygen-independent coproporphyrinogen III oxidase [Oxalobacter paraformigenes]